jgi:hypothetical protein
MVFEAICPELDFSDETIQKIQGIIDTNKKEIRLAYSDIEVSYTSILIRLVRAEIEMIYYKNLTKITELFVFF